MGFMNARNPWKRLPALTLTSLLMSCSGPDDGEGAKAGPEASAAGDADSMNAPFSTGLPPSTVLSALRDADARALCLAYQRVLPRLANCASFGMLASFNLAFDPNYAGGGGPTSDARLQRACSETRSQCEESLHGATPKECDSSRPPDCSATVGQYEACINDQLQSVSTSIAATPSCEDLRCASFADTARQWLEANEAASTGLMSTSCLLFTQSCSAPSSELSDTPAPQRDVSVLECAN